MDLNLLRVFAVVAETENVTAAAARLYLTQPAVSAALRRLTTAVGVPLFVRKGRGIVLTSRGARLQREVSLYLPKLVDAALAPATFDARSSDRTFRLGLSDDAEQWLLPRLLRVLADEAPGMRVIALPVQFRTVASALTSGAVELAISVTDELPSGIQRLALLRAGFVCLYDPRHAKLRTVTEQVYFAHEHVIVSYNGDLRGVIEDELKKTRNVRCSVPSFSHVGALIDGSARLATVPTIVADSILALRPHLRTKSLPFQFPTIPAELLWPLASDDDEPHRFLRAKIVQITSPGRPAARAAKGRG
ncbi:MAG TPA: LysR family transcriptional regulator [Polyangiales bacterium]|nr:LysR family transcriptional regulator [Polyangiales bacterium]